MLYIGKFINNFKDFYNDINGATLTGAIDVIVVRQPDGSYVCSPFHVRFGKIGVLRSKEKVVDIEVNGVPVDIHMKLGESGEAFFVEEVKTENEIPPYLATSPIPDVPDIEAELQKMKLSFSQQEVKLINKSGEVQLSVSNTNIVQITTEIQEVLISNSSPSSDPKDCDILPGDSVPKRKTAPNVSDVVKLLPKASKTLLESSLANKDISSNNVNTDSSDEYKTKRRRRKKVSTKKRSKPKDVPPSKTSVSRQTEVVASDCDKPEEIFQMDDVDKDGDEGCECSSMSRSVSLPAATTIDSLFGREWSRRKMSSTFTGEFHPFSDGDVTPQSSPVASRPPSPKSDTEYENQKLETGGGSPDANGPSWGWGQLPNVPRNLSSPHLQSLDDSSLPLNAENKDDDNSTEAEKRSMLGGMLNFMRSTKKMRHMPESEGIYLSELNSDELDPEVAALYFPKFKSTYSGPVPVKDEDTESGKGPSLPHSPHTVESYPLSQDSDSDERLSLDQFSDIAMSLCGGLQDPEVDLPEERFLHSLVTYDEFTENPAILSDPSLVIRLGGKFYNWQTAASMLTSIIMFQRPLPEKTTTQLIVEHMPKKKKKSYSSWWSWRRAEAEAKPELENASELAVTTGMEATQMINQNESLEHGVCESTTTEVMESVTVTIEQTVKETVASVTQAVACHEEEAPVLPPLPAAATTAAVEEDEEEEEQLEEVVVESETSLDDEQGDVEGAQIPNSRGSPVMSSTPIDISSSLRPASDINPDPVTPETVAQDEPSAKIVIEAEDEDKPKEKYMKSLRLSSKQIENLNLTEGPNEFVFSVTTAYQGTTKCTCQVFLWNFDDKIVISDIDGTITKSDVLGHILPMVGHSWAQLGVAQLFTKIQSNGYKFLYLSARAIGQARITREYLRKVRQGEICLPDGPLLLSPTSLISALHREVIERKPEEFKISCLKDIQTLFPSFMGNPFYAGFGNKINDNWAYRAVGIPLTRSFTINHKGELKLELIQTFQSSYSRLSDDVDHVFPPVKPRKTGSGNPAPIFSSPEEFSYFTYWREPVLPLSDEELAV